MAIITPSHHCAEDFYLALLDHADESVTDVFIDIQHGRLNHMVGALTRYFILFSRISIRPHLYSASRKAFDTRLADAIDASLLKERSMHINTPILVSDPKKYFGENFSKLKRDIHIHGSEWNEASSRLAHFFKPIARLLTDDLILKNIAKKVGTGFDEFARKKIISMHLRRGDLAVLDKKKYFDTPLESWFKSDLFCKTDQGWNFVDYQDFNLAKKEYRYHSAGRISRQKKLSFYDKILKNYAAEDIKIFLFSDGFELSARHFKQCSGCDLQVNEILPIMNSVEFNLEEGEEIILSVGPELDNDNKYVNLGFDELLSIAMNADVFVCMESGFPSSFINLLKLHSATKKSRNYVVNFY